MKNTKSFTGKAISMLIALFLLSCGGNNTSEQATNADASKPEPPKMDIHSAAITGNLEAIKGHIAAGSDLDKPDPFGGSSPMITATVFGNTEVVKALLEAGAEVNYKNKEGSTALHTAAFFCRTEIVELLIEKGVDKSIKNTYGATALESVQAPFEAVKPVYEMMEQQLSEMGLKLDYQRLENTRPVVADILKKS